MTAAALAEALEVTVHLSRSRGAVGAALRLRTELGSGIATSCASPSAGLVQRGCTAESKNNTDYTNWIAMRSNVTDYTDRQT